MQEEVNVRVDEAGEQRGVAEVDDRCALRMANGCANLANAVAFDKDFAGTEQGTGVDLKQAGRVEDDRGGGRLLFGHDGRKNKGQSGGETR
jgi:hypothetical protein